MRVPAGGFVYSFNIVFAYILAIYLGISIRTVSTQNSSSVDLANFTLRKCFCEPNHIYENGVCKSKNTEIDFVVKFWPTIEKEFINSNNFQNVIIENKKCPSTTQSLRLKRVSFNEQKMLFHMESGQSFSDNYCIEHVQKDSGDIEMQAYVCLPNFKVPACCTSESIFNSSSFSCVKSTTVSEFKPPVFLGSVFINTTENIKRYKEKFPSCDTSKLERKILDNQVLLQYQQGQIILFEMGNDPGITMPSTKFPSEYCIALERDGTGDELYSVLTWNEDDVVDCLDVPETNQNEEDDGEETCDNIMNLIVILLLSFSTFFLLLILVFHAIMPELRKSLGSKITVCHVTSLFCGFCLLLFLHIPHSQYCKVYGPLIQICFLATFFWLNVMCFDIWWKLWCRSPAGETVQSAKSQFYWYSLYAWGCPLVIGVITIVMDNLPQLEDNPWVIVPGFGKYNCWFAEKNAALVYYFGIIGLLMGTNAFFFIWVFGIVFSANCAYKKILKNNPNASSRAWIYWKIFGVMGITWIFEFSSWQEGTCKYWIITDIINALRGVILFLIFFGNRKSLRKMREKFASINETIHNHVNRSVNNLRKFSLKPPTSGGTVETGVDLTPGSLGIQNSEGNNNNNGKKVPPRCKY